MTDTLVVNPDTRTVPLASYVEWAPVFAGTVVALSVSFVLLGFGSAVGLAVVSPWSMAPISQRVIWGGVFWFLLVQLWAFAVGGYIAGRMRHRWPGASDDEVAFRDGAHGLLVWGTAIAFGVFLGSSAIVATGRPAADTANTPITIALDHLFRTTQPNALSTSSADLRAEAGRLLMTSRDGSLLPADRTYLAQLVAARTAISPAEADARIATVSEQLRATTDTARKVGIVLGFLVAASLLVAAATAWWTAVLGGNHRDAGTVWEGFSRRQTLWFLPSRPVDLSGRAR